MDFEMTDELIKVLDYLFDKLGVIVDWSNGEIIPYIKELATKIVAYKESIAWMWIIFSIVLAIAGIVTCIVTVVKDADGFILFLGAAAIIAGVSIGLYNGHTVIACKTFPEKVVVEYVQDTMDELKNDNKTR